MATVRLARRAMATRFELVLEGEDEVWLRAAGEEALAEIQRLEAQLSIFRPSSEVSRLNARAGKEPVRVETGLFRLLQTAMRISRETDGAFDVTVAPLMRAWGFFRDTGRMPDPNVLEEARQRTGMRFLTLDEETRTVRFDRPDVTIDLGAIGKGYAVDQAIALLRDLGVENAFLHGGASTMFGLGHPRDAAHWNVAVPYPGSDEEAGADAVLALARLEDTSMSISAVWGKAFETADGKTYGHVLDPRLGSPVEGAVLAAVVCSSATEADALATAFLVLGRECRPLLRTFRERLRALILLPADPDDVFDVMESGFPPLPSERRRICESV